jgi:hypothetical protein
MSEYSKLLFGHIRQAYKHSRSSRILVRRGAPVPLITAFALMGFVSTAQAVNFSKAGAIAIPDSGQAVRYPSNITVSGLTGTVISVEQCGRSVDLYSQRARIWNISHKWASRLKRWVTV